MIRVQRLAKIYHTSAEDHVALRRVDLAVAAGEFVAITGKSGSGKSTLLNMLAGIDRPSSGSVEVGGTAIQALKQSQLAAWRGKNVGFVFQFFQLLPTLTIAENVMLPMDFCRVYPVKHRRKRALDLLERVGIAAHANKLPSGLSGGEQQRAAIARALANDPAMILADEPTGNLDSTTGEVVLKLFCELATIGTTVVIATHEREISRLVNRKVELTDGSITADSTSPRTLVTEDRP